MIENVAVAFALQIEITVLAHVDRSGLVRCSLVVDDEFVRIRQSVTDCDFKIAGEPFLSVLTEVRESDTVLSF